MPAKSKKQQRLMGMVHAYKMGQLPNASPMIKRIAKHITNKRAKEFAETSTKGLPTKVGSVMLNELGFKKHALLGPAVDIGWLGIPSLAGYFLGRDEGYDMARAEEPRPRFGPSSIAGLAFMPGAAGYIVGKRVGYRRGKRKRND